MIHYDTEAVRYDATRGGEPRAQAAADAVESLLPAAAHVVLDVAGGTGIVGSKVNRRVFSVDRSTGMSAYAARRMPGRVVVGDAGRLPFADHSVDAGTLVWLLHLLDEPTSARVVGEAVRVLRKGGTLVTTVDKNTAHRETPDDLGELLTPLREEWPTDGLARLTSLGLAVVGRTTFTGFGQGRSPHQWLKRGLPHDVSVEVAALPDQYRPRAEPEYQLVAFSVDHVRRDDLLAQRHQ